MWNGRKKKFFSCIHCSGQPGLPCSRPADWDCAHLQDHVSQTGRYTILILNVVSRCNRTNNCCSCPTYILQFCIIQVATVRPICKALNIACYEWHVSNMSTWDEHQTCGKNANRKRKWGRRGWMGCVSHINYKYAKSKVRRATQSTSRTSHVRKPDGIMLK